MFAIFPSPRLRRSPFFEATVAEGVKSFSPYNHMLMPTGYGDPMAEYWRLINGVAMWDVAVERQVEILGPDAARLVQMLVPRRLDRLRPGMGWYVAVCNHHGTIINDPILLKLADDRYWLSIADSDVALVAQAVAGERGLDVRVFEPDVSPLAIQGPKAEDVVARLLGDEIRAIKHFQFKEMSIEGIPLQVARSGWSKQGGFELYLMDGTRGTDLWNLVKEAGAPDDIGPGNPNPMERVESGLLSWGGDTDEDTNPFEVRMERYVDLDAPDDVISIQALRRLHAEGIKRQQLGVKLKTQGHLQVTENWSTVIRNNEAVGHMTARTWSPRLECNIGLTLVSRDASAGDHVRVNLRDGTSVDGELCALPFI